MVALSGSLNSWIIIHSRCELLSSELIQFILIQDHIPLGSRGVQTSVPESTTRRPLMRPWYKQGDVTAQGQQGQGTITLHHLIYKPQQNLTTFITKTLSTVKVCSILTSSCSMADLLIPWWELTVLIQAHSVLTLQQPWLKWVTLNHSLAPAAKSGKTAESQTKNFEVLKFSLHMIQKEFQLRDSISSWF